MSIAPGIAVSNIVSSRRLLRNLLFCVVCLSVITPSATAQSTWLGLNASWSNPANWSTNSIPDQNSQLHFAASTAFPVTINDIASPNPLLVNSISVLSTAPGAILIAGNPFIAQNGIHVDAGKDLVIMSGIGTSGNPASNLTFSGGGNTSLIGTPLHASNAQIQSGIIELNTTLNGPLFVNSNASILTGNGSITGNLAINGGNVTPGLGITESTISVGGNMTVDGTIDIRLFGTGYTNPNDAEIAKIDVVGSVNINSAVFRLNLGALSVAEVNQLRADTLANGPYRDYTVVATGSGFSGSAPTLTIPVLGNFDPNEWSLLPVNGGNDAQLRFQPVPEPTAIVGAFAAAVCLAGLAKRRKVRQLSMN